MSASGPLGSLVSESGHVAYRITRNAEYSDRLHPGSLGWGQTVKHFFF